jgi:hypothetical protein
MGQTNLSVKFRITDLFDMSYPFLSFEAEIYDLGMEKSAQFEMKS